MIHFCERLVIWTIRSGNAGNHGKNSCVILRKVIICRAMTIWYTWATRSRSACQTVFLDCSTFIAVIEHIHFIDCIQAHNVEIHLGRMSLPFTIREWGFHLRLSTNSAAKYFTLTAFFFSCSVDLYSLPTESNVFQYQTCTFAKCIRIAIDVTNLRFKGTFMLSWRLIIVFFRRYYLNIKVTIILLKHKSNSIKI